MMCRLDWCLGLAAAALLALAAPTTRAAIDPETAVGVWLMDEDGGRTVEDSSGRGFDGVLTGNGAVWAAGKFGSALKFDWASWVSIPDHPDLEVGDQLSMMASCQRRWKNPHFVGLEFPSFGWCI